MNAPAATCTIELSHGGVVHLAEDIASVRERVWDSRTLRGFATFKRLAGSAGALPKGEFVDFYVDPRHIVGIYPLDSHSARPDVHVWRQ